VSWTSSWSGVLFTSPAIWESLIERGSVSKGVIERRFEGECGCDATGKGVRSSTWRYHYRFACSYVYHVERFHRNAEEPMLSGSGDLEAGGQCLAWYPDETKRTSSHAVLISKSSAIVTYCSRYLLHPCWKVQMKRVSTMYTFYHDAIVSFYRVCATARQEHRFR
jgi:hypothetical protein